MGKDKDSKYEICLFESLEDFAKCESERIYCMKIENRWLLYSGVIIGDTTILYCYFLDAKPTKFMKLNKAKDVVEWYNTYVSDAVPIIFVTKNSLVKKILTHFKGRI